MRCRGITILLVILGTAAHAERVPGPLQISRPAGTLRVSLPEEPIPPVGGSQYLLQVETSTDLNLWTPTGQLAPAGDGSFQFAPATTGGQAFFRLRPQITDSGSDVDAAALVGYQRVFAEELRKAGFLTPGEFAAHHPPSSNFLAGIAFDPRTLAYWTRFAADPAVVNKGITTNSPDWRSYDFRLNPQELAVFLTNGFVVSERLGSDRFADVFYRLFNDDMPVFVSADSVLHAWHFSFEHMLSELEETHLAPLLDGQDIPHCGGSDGWPPGCFVHTAGMLDLMADQLTAVPTSVREGPLRDSLADVDYFLAVARSLARGSQVATVLGPPDTNVGLTLTAIMNQAQYFEPPGFPMYGTSRLMDFSQFQVRGYYDRSLQLQHYFQTFMWTARADFRILNKFPTPQSLRELGAATVLSLLLESSGQAAGWRELDSLLRLFIGRPDEMNFAQLKPMLDAAGITSLDSITDPSQLVALQAAIFNGNLGLQLIPGDAYLAPFGLEQVQLPRSFAFTGQRFVPDGWALANVTYDRVPVFRRVPSALDAMYGVLGNREIGWEISQRMLAPQTPGNFRDGFPYADSLEALAATFDRMNVPAWQDSIYTRWLYALRALSAPTTGAEFPQAVRTRAWAMRTLNTQLASYTELKHDTVLYAKQPYSAIFSCVYPAGFIEPVPEFWRRMREMAESAAAGLLQFPIGGVSPIVPAPPNPSGTPTVTVDLGQRHAARVSFCTNFAAVMGTLEQMAGKELRQEPFSAAETNFIRGLMNRQDHAYFGASYDGWYPDLYYKDYALALGSADENGSNKYDALVTDIFTAPPDQIDPVGGVLHEATGLVDYLLIAVDNGPAPMVYAGPVLSHYEFLKPGPVLQRLTDSDWQTMLYSPTRPARPEWTRSYLVPKGP